MYIHRSGYKPPEQIATHCRRRYRLLPGKNSNPTLAPCDPSLWIVHYSRADPSNELPANQIRPNPMIQRTMNERRMLQQQGQLIRKEFMLQDRGNYPTIKLPGGAMPQYAQQVSGYPGNVISHMNRSQRQSYYPPRQAGNMAGMGASPAKRPRVTQQANTSGLTSSTANGSVSQEDKVKDEEDTSKGDLMDILTPQDISSMRYMQHHEWLEEVFSSPYATSRIIPVELGLGRKGELETLTTGFFEAPTGIAPKPKGERHLAIPINGTRRIQEEKIPARVGKMEPGKAEDFTKLASQRIADLNAEMEKMKRQHAKRMAKLNQGTTLMAAEKRLRSAVHGPPESEDEPLRLVRQSHSPICNDGASATPRQSELIGDIVEEVEAVVGKQIQPQSDVTPVQKGGLEEKPHIGISKSQESATHGELDDQPNDIADTGSPSKSFLGSYGTATPMSRDPSSLHQGQSTAGTPQVINSQMVTPGGAHEISGSGQATPQLPPGDDDIVMAGTSHGMDLSTSDGSGATQATANGEASDWVMVNREVDVDTMPQVAEGSFDPGTFSHDTGMVQSMDTPGVFVNTPGSGLQGLTPAARSNANEDYNANDFDETVDFSNLDTAGDALAGYGEENEDIGLDEHGDIDLDTSAFGEAFHGTELNAGREEGTDS